MPAATVTIESLDQEGRGVAHVDGKAIFVEGALDRRARPYRNAEEKPSYEIARVVAVEAASASRVTPRCPHFGVCGGCTLQHADPALQIAAKQRALEEAFAQNRPRAHPRHCCRRSTVPHGATAIGRGCRSATCRRRAACSSASTSANRASSPT